MEKVNVNRVNQVTCVLFACFWYKMIKVCRKTLYSCKPQTLLSARGSIVYQVLSKYHVVFLLRGLNSFRKKLTLNKQMLVAYK